MDASPRLTTDQRLLIEARISNERKSVGVAYALWFFLGIFAIHRFYLGRPGSAILMILSYFILIGFVWWIVDAFLIPDLVRKHTAATRERLLNAVVAGEAY